MKKFLESERLYLREITQQDLPLLFELHSDPEVMKFIRPHEKKLEETQVTLERIIRTNNYQNGLGLWMCHENISNDFIGWFVLICYLIGKFHFQQSVAKEWGVTTEGLRSKTRTKNLTVPRQVAMHMMRELLGMQLVEIGAAFGGRDHSTVIHSLERVAAMMKEDPSFAQRLAKLQSALESLRN